MIVAIRLLGEWQNKSPDPAGQPSRLVIEWTADL